MRVGWKRGGVGLGREGFGFRGGVTKGGSILVKKRKVGKNEARKQ